MSDFFRRCTAAALFLYLLTGELPLPAQEAAAPAKASGVRITFLPPPMAGTVSLGIYNKAGKLVRVLRREADPEKGFATGLNGLILNWDGKDDAGATVPAGRYFARGYGVGSLSLEGVAFHGNDWMADEDSPHIRRLLPVCAFEDGFQLTAEMAGGGLAAVAVNPEGDVTAITPCTQTFEREVREKLETEAKALAAAEPGEGRLWRTAGGGEVSFCDGKLRQRASGGAWEAFSMESQTKLIDASYGGESLWLISDPGTGPELGEYSLDGELLRRLPAEPGSLPPARVLAKGRDLLFVLEASKAGQRTLIYQRDSDAAAPEGEAQPVSLWRTLLSKTIWWSDTFEAIAGKLDRPKPFAPEEKCRVKLVPNPLFQEAMHDVDVRLAIDSEGAELVSADGLPLARLSQAEKLRWAVMARVGGGSKAITILQSDGSVVEEFRAQRLANMMAFDAGEYDWPSK